VLFNAKITSVILILPSPSAEVSSKTGEGVEEALARFVRRVQATYVSPVTLPQKIGASRLPPEPQDKGFFAKLFSW
jgi:hypothetical protein